MIPPLNDHFEFLVDLLKSKIQQLKIITKIKVGKENNTDDEVTFTLEV